MTSPVDCTYCWGDGLLYKWYWPCNDGAVLCIVGWVTKTEGYEWFGTTVSYCACIKTWASEFGIDIIEFDVDSDVRREFFASSATNVERTELMINWDDDEAISLSATSAAIAAADFLVAASDCEAASVPEVLLNDAFCEESSLSSRFCMLLASSICACAT